MAGYHHKTLLVNETFVDPKVAVDLRGGSVTLTAPYARIGHVSFDKRSFKLTTPVVESCGYLGRGGGKLVD